MFCMYCLYGKFYCAFLYSPVDIGLLYRTMNTYHFLQLNTHSISIKIFSEIYCTFFSKSVDRNAQIELKMGLKEVNN